MAVVLVPVAYLVGADKDIIVKERPDITTLVVMNEELRSVVRPSAAQAPRDVNS